MTFNTTLLTLSGDGVPPYSARGLRQTLEPIAQAISLHRTVNAKLLNFAPPQMQKYKTEISGNDQQPPAFNNFWPGQPLTVNTACSLAFLTANSVPGRMVASSYIDGDYTIFQLTLACIVINWSLDTDEWGAMTGWKLNLEEA